MKQVSAIVKPETVADIQRALERLAVLGLTLTDARGWGRQKGRTEIYRGTQQRADLVPRARIDVLVDDESAGRVAAAMADAAWTGALGDGKVWVTHVDKVIRVRTGERDGEAV